MTTRQVLAALRRHESRNITYLAGDGGWPIVWERARGCHVWDVEGRRYLDLTAAFGVAAAGHANPRVVKAGRAQMGRLLHAMGDVHPHALKAQLVRELSRLTFGRWKAGAGKTILGNSGFEAVEAALKTARRATGRRAIMAFAGGYHGLGYGALNGTHRGHFREAFRDQLGEFGRFVPFASGREGPRPGVVDEAPIDVVLEKMDAVQRREPVGAVLVEPMQARGGIRLPAPGFLKALRSWCDRHGALLILDEIYTGFGRTGRWFACEHDAVVPDLICLGKALTGGFPMSACVGRSDLMDEAWPASTGEAIHTSTFLGHPVGCAMALAQLKELRERRLAERAAAVSSAWRAGLEEAASVCTRLRAEVRVIGLMGGVELRTRDGAPAGADAVRAVEQLLREGFILLPEGEAGQVIGLTPPLVIPEMELRRTTRALRKVLAGY